MLNGLSFQITTRLPGAFAVAFVSVMLVWLQGVSAATLEIRDLSVRNRPYELSFTPVCNAKLTGRIRSGDFDRIRQQLRDNGLVQKIEDNEYFGDEESTDQEGYYALCLQSEGGDIREALRIGDLFNGWMTVVEADQRCISACALLFMKGPRREHLFVSIHPGPQPNRKAGRFLHYRATLAFHAPSLEIPSGAADKLTPQLVQEYYRRAVRTVGSIIFPGEGDNEESGNLDPGRIKEKLEDYNFVGGPEGTENEFIPFDLLFAVVSVPPDQEFAIKTVAQAIRWGIEPYGFPGPRFISERMLFMGCANLVAARCVTGGPLGTCVKFSTRQYFRPPYIEDGRAEELDDYFERHRDRFRIAKRKLWPPSNTRSSLTVHGLTITREFSNYAVCDAKLIYNNGALLEIELHTINGQGDRPPIRGGNFTADDAKTLTDQTAEGPDIKIGKNRRLRPWQMLPSSWNLVDLGSAPWKELEKGGPLFSPPSPDSVSVGGKKKKR